MTRSIRYQLVALVGAMLVGGMATYFFLANGVFTQDKQATVYDVNALVANAAAEQAEATLNALLDKLRYFGTEQVGSTGDGPAKKLFVSDDEVLALEIWHKKATGRGYERIYGYADEARLSTLNLTKEDLEAARQQTPVEPEAVSAQGSLLQNASMPPDVALLRLSTMTPDGQAVVVADLRPERLLKITSSSGLYKVFLVDAKGQVLSHPDPQKVLQHADVSSLQVVKDALEAKVTRGSRDYQAPEGDMLASYARLDSPRAAVVVEAPRAEVFKATRELTFRSLLFALAVIASALVAAIYFSRRLTAPLRSLVQTMARVSKGEFGIKVEVTSKNEIGAVAGAFNEMSHELGRRSSELDQKNQQLIQSEKLSAIGELSAGLAHEVKNPMVGIVGFAQLGQESTSLDEAKEYFKLIDADAQRANAILQRLLDFARPPDVTREKLQVNAMVESAMQLVAHPVALMGVKVETRFAEGLPSIEGNSNQLRQVLINLMMNAAQAMEASEQKRLYVETTGADWAVVITVKDTGPGIAPEVKQRLFEPFFTTKPRGKGTGLGLSISRSIIEEHQGEIRVESEVGKGTTFVIRLAAGQKEAPSVKDTAA
ncbi:MAG: ATP-binding protein [Myxococcaceae bacterium]